MQIQKSRKLLRGKSFKRSLITIYQLLMTAALTGCMGVYEGGFECPPGEGVGCKSISEVNHMVDQSAVPSAQYSVPSVQCSEKKGSEIWYAPTFELKQKENCQTKVLDDAHSI